MHASIRRGLPEGGGVGLAPRRPQSASPVIAGDGREGAFFFWCTIAARVGHAVVDHFPSKPRLVVPTALLR
jgi:hypothetical protein